MLKSGIVWCFLVCVIVCFVIGVNLNDFGVNLINYGGYINIGMSK